MASTMYRRPGSEARRVRNLVFDRLPPVVRDRLATSLASGGAPEPLLVDASWRKPPSARRWRLVAAAAAIVEVVLWFKGFGDVESPLALQPLAFAAAHGAAIFALLFSLLRAARIARGQSGAPFPEGRYLFPLDLVEVEGPHLRLTDLHTLRRVEARPGKRGPSVVLVFADAHEITFEAQPQAEALALRVWAAVHAAAALILPDDQPRMERLDPFFELRVADDWASADAAADARRSLLVRSPLPALAGALLAASALAGLGLHALRNRLSDDEMFAQAIKIPAGTMDGDRWKVGPYAGVRNADAYDALRLERATGNEDALEAYLRSPGARRREAEEALFAIWKSDPRALALVVKRGGPRAEQAAEALFDLQKGDLDALAAYIRKRGAYADRADEQLFALAQKSGEARSYRFYLQHGKRHADEVQSKLLPEAAYLDAKKSNDAGLFGDFVREYPDSAHVEEIKAQLHALYVDALRAYGEKKPSAASLRFVTALLAELEDRADPSVTIEVVVDPGAAILTADTALGSRLGAEYLPAEAHFDASSLSALAAQLRTDLAASIFATFANGTVKPIGTGLHGETGRPSILVTCEPVVSDVFVSRREQLKFANVRFQVDLHAVVPARAQELAWKFTTPGSKDFDVKVKAGGDHGDKTDRADFAEVSYGRMKSDALTQITERLQLDF
jgi:hypothetical protein